MTKQNTPHNFDFLIGTDTTTNEKVWLDQRDFSLGGYFLGVRRVGKSSILQSLIADSMRFGFGVVAIDPHGDLLGQVCNRIPQNRMDDVIFYDPLDENGKYPIGLNIYHCEDKFDPVAVQYTVDGVMSLYKKLWTAEFSQPMVEDVLRMTALTIIANELTMVDIPRLLFNDAFRRKLVANVTNPDVLDFWKIYEDPRSLERTQGGGTVGRRLRAFTTSGVLRSIVGQTSVLPFREILDQKKILLVSLPGDKMEKLTTMLGSIIVAKLLQAALMRSDTDNRPQCHLYCDEYSVFATDDFATIISQAGKYNIIPFLAHQSIGQISEQNQDSAMQLGNFFCFRLIGRDGEIAAKQYDATPPEEKKVVPSNVLSHLNTHPSEIVREFESQYVRKLVEAKTLRETSEREDIQIAVELDGTPVTKPRFYKEDPEYDFGAGVVSFYPLSIPWVLGLIERTVYFAMTDKEYYQSDTYIEDMRNILSSMRYHLRYANYYDAVWKARTEEPLLITKDFSTRLIEKASSQKTQQLEDECIRYYKFYFLLATTMRVVRLEPIKLVSSTGNFTQRNYADMRGEIANELRGLPVRTMKVRLATGQERTVKTPDAPKDYTDTSGKKQKVLQQTRHRYAKTREQVEAEILKRQRSDDEPQTKRRGTV